MDNGQEEEAVGTGGAGVTMKLSSGQRNTLVRMGIDPERPTVREYGPKPIDHPVSEDELRTFFAYTDRGIQPSTWSPILCELHKSFRAIAITEADWRHDFAQGMLSPFNFYDDLSPTYEAARRADKAVQGFSRTLWRIMDVGRKHGQPLRRVYSLLAAVNRGRGRRMIERYRVGRK